MSFFAYLDGKDVKILPGSSLKHNAGVRAARTRLGPFHAACSPQPVDDTEIQFCGYL